MQSPRCRKGKLTTVTRQCDSRATKSAQEHASWEFVNEPNSVKGTKVRDVASTSV
jgi:hypothetical protein